MSRVKIVLKPDDDTDPIERDTNNPEIIETMIDVLNEFDPKYVGILVDIEADFQSDFDIDEFKKTLPEGWGFQIDPIQNEIDARAVAAAISVYERRQDASLADEASAVADRVERLIEG